MNRRLLSVLLFALVISAVASVVLYRLISSRLIANQRPATVKVVVASHNLDLGAMIKDADLKTVDWSGPEPKGALGNPADIVNRGVVAKIYEGEPIVDNRLAPKGGGAGMAAMIPPGMRAVAVRVNDVAGVAGFVLPGTRVDILIAGTPPGGSGGMGTIEKTLLQNIEVLSAGQNIQKDAEGKPVSVPVVNLLVTAAQAEILSLASSETRIQLVLRNPLDTARTETPGTAIANLFSGETGALPGPKSAPKPASKPRSVQVAKVDAPAVVEQPKIIIPLTVEVITGTHRAETKFKPEEVRE